MQRMLLVPICLLAVALSEQPPAGVRFELVGRHGTGHFDMSTSEVPAWHAASRRLFVVNAAEGLDIIDIAEPAALRRIAVRRQVGATSVAVHGDLVAWAVAGSAPGARGLVRLLDGDGRDRARLAVGFGPDMVTFTPDGTKLLVACEGECPAPSAGASTGTLVDPHGTVAIIDLADGIGTATVTELGFDAFEVQRSALIERGLRVVSPGRSLAEDLEPEYIAMAPDGRHAFVTLQENNAIAVIDLERREVRSIEPLGFRDCSRPGMGIDAVVDGVGDPRPVPVLAMYQPDAIVAFDHDGVTWLVTANEGEAREGSFNEAITWRQAMAMRNGTASLAREPEPWGELLVSCVPAPASAGGGLCAFGTRSVSLWRFDPETSRISLAWDSGEAIERLIAERTPALFNADHRRGPNVDARSLSKGPEPEGLALATISGRRLVFVAFERSGGVMALDLTDPARPSFVGRFDSRDPLVDLSVDLDRYGIPDHWESAGDLGPEAMTFIPSASSPTGEDLLVVCNEVSGTTTILRVITE